jgi:hypothetical protein
LAEREAAHILDLKIALDDIPPWMEKYSTALEGCGHKIIATMKTISSWSDYREFVHDLRAMLSATQWKSLKKVFFNILKQIFPTIINSSRKDEALALWDERRAPM